jgi:hypothetical protein
MASHFVTVAAPPASAYVSVSTTSLESGGTEPIFFASYAATLRGTTTRHSQRRAFGGRVDHYGPVLCRMRAPVCRAKAGTLLRLHRHGVHHGTISHSFPLCVCLRKLRCGRALAPRHVVETLFDALAILVHVVAPVRLASSAAEEPAWYQHSSKIQPHPQPHNTNFISPSTVSPSASAAMQGSCRR